MGRLGAGSRELRGCQAGFFRNGLGIVSYRPVSPSRRLVTDFLGQAAGVPIVAIGREINVRAVQAARSAMVGRPPISWMTIFMKAWGIASQRCPTLRQAYIRWPYPRLYEHPRVELAMFVEKELAGENAVFGAKLREPGKKSLAELQDLIIDFRDCPLEKYAYFRQIVRLGRLPGLVRRMVLWSGLHLSGPRRAKHFGTGAISSLGQMGAEVYFAITPLTSYFLFDRVQPTGMVSTKLFFDHRVMDGREASKCLAELEAALQQDILAELQAPAIAAA